MGDAGEHYALSQFAFAGLPALKMPDGWTAYDLAVEPGNGLLRVSVKTRAESEKWAANSWFIFDDRRECDWIVFLFKPYDGTPEAWVMPFEVAKANANQPGPTRKDPHNRDVSYRTLMRRLARYRSNWGLVEA